MAALERLHKWMAGKGIASRRKCEEYIQQGLVKVNGKVVREMGIKIDPDKDRVELEPALQKTIKHHQENLVYIMLNKPRGYVSSVTGPENPKVAELVKSIPQRVFPVGRLDKDTSGLMLLTNDGRFAYEMTHPKFQKEKEYEVTLPSAISDEKLTKLSSGVEIYKKATSAARRGYRKKTSPAKVRRISASKFSITITEGMNRQIRRMCRAVGFPHIAIKRVRVGNLLLPKNLQEGKYKILSEREANQAKADS